MRIVTCEKMLEAYKRISGDIYQSEKGNKIIDGARNYAFGSKTVSSSRTF
jgi:hypothetical protein